MASSILGQVRIVQSMRLGRGRTSEIVSVVTFDHNDARETEGANLARALWRRLIGTDFAMPTWKRVAADMVAS
jgi:hypothetical protein